MYEHIFHFCKQHWSKQWMKIVYLIEHYWNLSQKTAHTKFNPKDAINIFRMTSVQFSIRFKIMKKSSGAQILNTLCRVNWLQGILHSKKALFFSHFELLINSCGWWRNCEWQREIQFKDHNANKSLMNILKNRRICFTS